MAEVDDEDYSLLSKYSWRLHNRGYAITNSGKKRLLMHRIVLKAKKGQEIDHINRNKLDNRKSNLRFCTRSENMLNRGFWGKTKSLSGIAGVHWNKSTEKWQARVQINGIRYNLGMFQDKNKAAQAVAEIKGF